MPKRRCPSVDDFSPGWCNGGPVMTRMYPYHPQAQFACCRRNAKTDMITPKKPTPTTDPMPMIKLASPPIATIVRTIPGIQWESNDRIFAVCETLKF